MIGSVRPTLGAYVLVLCVAGLGPSASAQEPGTDMAPTRTADGGLTLRAVRVTTPLNIDGRLDEPLYTDVVPISDFIQTEPSAGQPVSDPTELWVAFDDLNVYITFRCWDPHPERRIASELRRDSNLIVSRDDHVAFALDTFYDRRNSVMFAVNPNGGFVDGQVTAERQWTGDWNPIWQYRTEQFDGGWTLEAALPFKSLRYQAGAAQTWGFTARRMSRWKNEIAYITRVPDGSATSSIMMASFYATLEGVEVPSGAKNLEVKPYVTGDLTSNLAATPRISNKTGSDAGVDVKYGVTQNLTADVTINTDFAQVEADEQQINLTRFSLFFPEKREFFLENAGTFDFGGSGGFGGGGGNTPTLFYSRRIGLEQNQVVPVRAGGRLTGRVGQFNVGVMNIQTGDAPTVGTRGVNFAAVRVKRDLFRRSSIGAIFTRRSIAVSGIGSNETYGVDGAFSFFDDLSLNAYWARTYTAGLGPADESYRGRLDYNGDRYGLQLAQLVVGRDFNPEVGFVPRADIRRSFGSFRFSPRPDNATIRKLSWTASVDHVANGQGRLESRDLSASFSVELESSDVIRATVTETYEFLERPFALGQGVTVPPGGYSFGTVTAGYNFGQQRRIFGNLSVEHGGFYDGHATAVTFRAGRAEVNPRLTLEPSVSINWIETGLGSFRSDLIGTRVTFTATPRMFASALVQYNSRTRSVSSNIRFRWEYQPGSEMFVVYNEQRDTLSHRFPDLTDRAVIVKINRLFRF